MKITELDINILRQITLFGRKHPSYLDEESILLEELHEYIVRKKSIKGIEIEIPSMDFTSATIDFFHNGKKYKGCGGIYFLYGEDGGLLNIGSTDDLYVRIYQKLIGKNGGSRADSYFCHYYKGVSLFCENNHHKRKVYEPYLINKLQPPLNDKYNYYNKSLYYELLKKEEEASSPFFGYKSSYA
ncbi:GIY-YIG nuclease family protein [Neobacillus driksii]|uniref:GIY-YIG nuclease family protein n=1 Tax=Neobacillus driksii TaxID=3035913 RepID=UPI0035BC3E32